MNGGRTHAARRLEIAEVDIGSIRDTVNQVERQRVLMKSKLEVVDEGNPWQLSVFSFFGPAPYLELCEDPKLDTTHHTECVLHIYPSVTVKAHLRGPPPRELEYLSRTLF